MASVPAEKKSTSACVATVEKVPPAVPVAIEFQKASTPHVPFGVAPAPVDVPLESQ